jgi:hypothetical protein
VIFMVLLDEGLEELAVQFEDLIDDGQWGTATTLPDVTDTGLGSPVTATLLAVSTTSSGNSTQFTHALDSLTGNGNILTEFELQFVNGDSLMRQIGGPITKTDSFELTTIVTVNFVRG